MKHITRIAIKTPSGSIKTTPIGKHHDDLNAEGRRGFMTSDKQFVNRTEATRIARKSGQTTVSTPLHSHQLKKVG